MSKLKRRLRRMHKGKPAAPFVRSFCEDGCLVTAVRYKGEDCLSGVPGVTTDDYGLGVLDEAIRYLFKEMPWKTKEDLLALVDLAVDNFIERAEKTVKGN